MMLALPWTLLPLLPEQPGRKLQPGGFFVTASKSGLSKSTPPLSRTCLKTCSIAAQAGPFQARK